MYRIPFYRIISEVLSRTIALALLILFTPQFLSGQGDTINYKTFRTISIDPDGFSMVVSRIGEKWNNKIGGEYDIDFLKGKRFSFGSSIGGFVNIHNFDEGQELSWQLWRGSVGISAFCDFHITDKSDIKAELSWIHESQHATDINAYTRKFILNPGLYDNAIARSFEYIKLNIGYLTQFPNNNWHQSLILGYRYYPLPLGYNSNRILLNSLSLEAGVDRKIYKRFYFYSSFYFENIYNNFIAGERNYLGDWFLEPFKYRILEIGLGNRNAKDKTLNLFFCFSNSNGRGLDFLQVSQSFGVGLRIVL